MSHKPIDRYEIAKHAIRSAFLSWGVAWVKLDKETRKAYLTLAIVEYMTGMCRPYQPEWEKVGEQPWTAKDVREALSACECWSETDKRGRDFGVRLIGFAPRDEKDPNDPITLLEAHFRRIYG